MFKFGSEINDNDDEVIPNRSKKQMAIAERHRELLLIAKDIISAEGFHGFTMDKLASASGYSKGTIYNHFASKEDVIVTISCEALKTLAQMYKKAYQFEGGSRDKVVALHVAYRIFSRLEPVLFMCVLTSKTPWVVEKSTAENIEKQNLAEEKLVEIADKFILDAIDGEDLTLAATASTDAYIFANWAVAFGSNALLNNATNSQCIQRIEDPYSVLYNVNIVLDGMNWQPLSSRRDYKKVWREVEQTIFADETAYLAQIGR
ncbi:TetR family transcriptional regulator [Pseudoalteromonas luteoviolacea]|uniref:TetR family transcriptional regulator n=1 Tax=Pseudoalteromonas luteoviolacea TaxID=43657 RepID=A0A1C0TME7_9GAMM|nr:TetR/AcrR family transcriptional regulator [Pseudoalteromonas luteoviolacea]MBQ4812251.1 TetR/AcrR family transcriptional regulator [Pseudoalteromonas luteoviolacea]OCQ20000.1 TetR family transcriptional regulator [Pseudoalteromonas luteoviolacea]